MKGWEIKSIEFGLDCKAQWVIYLYFLIKIFSAPAGTQSIEKVLKSNNMSYRERK